MATDLKPADWLKLAQDAYQASTSFVDTNYRKKWEYGIRAFQNEHAPGSKYLSEEYKSRSRIFRPKTRATIRKNEAAAALALFSSPDLLQVEAGNPDDVYAVAGASVVKELMQYRLTRTIPWFQTCIGAIQDAQTVGVVCSYQYWDYATGKDGNVVKDRPCIKLRPVENIRIDPAADWIDPVESSPYMIDIQPMYVTDLRRMARENDPKTGAPKFKSFTDADLARARPDVMDTTRRLRSATSEDPQDNAEDAPISDYEMVWVLKQFHRVDGEDYCYYTLGTEKLLSDPKPIKEVYFHGKRPYVIGCVILETHKALPDGVAWLAKPIQQETTDIANQRLDNVKFVLNKRWIVARGRQVDVQSLVRNVPGGVTMATDPNMDIKESNWPDVTSSSYVEQDRLNVDFDDLVGNFSAGSVQTNRALNETVGGMRMLNNSASIMTEYLLRTFIETWVIPVLRQLMLLEQYYESDQTVMAIAAEKARLFPRFGIARVTDQLLEQELLLSVNVGQGATDPNARLQKFLTAVNSAIALVGQAPPGFNVMEAVKEIFSFAGYRDGARFFSQQQDPRLAKAMQMIQALQGQVQGKQMELQAKGQIEMAKVQSEERTKTAEIMVNRERIAGDLQIRSAEVAIEQARLELERLRIAMDAEGSTVEQQFKVADMAAKLEAAKLKLESEKQKLTAEAVKLQAEARRMDHDIQMAEREAATVESNEQRVGQVAEGVGSMVESMRQEMAQMRTELDSKEQIGELRQGMSQLAGLLAGMAAKPEPSRRNVRKLTKKRGQDGRMSGVLIEFDDGMAQEVEVG